MQICQSIMAVNRLSIGIPEYFQGIISSCSSYVLENYGFFVIDSYVNPTSSQIIITGWIKGSHDYNEAESLYKICIYSFKNFDCKRQKVILFDKDKIRIGLLCEVCSDLSKYIKLI